MLKWTGALAAAGVVGIGLGVGGDLLLRPNTTKTLMQTSTQTLTQTETTAEIQTVTGPVTTQTTTNTATVTGPVTTQTTTNTATVTGPVTTQTTTNTATVTGPVTTQTTTVTAPAPTLSYVPPLSPSVQTRVSAITQQLIDVHANDVIKYTNCKQNGCYGSCLIKAHVTNGVVTSVEPDNSINYNVAIEDQLGASVIKSGMIQSRACAMGYAFKADLYNPEQTALPNEKIWPSRNKKFCKSFLGRSADRHSDRDSECHKQVWAYSIWGSGVSGGWVVSTLGPYFGAGVAIWGLQSYPESSNAGNLMLATADKNNNFLGTYAESGADATELLNSKLIILWGWDPLDAWQHTINYYLTLAREAGIPIIAIEPKVHQKRRVICQSMDSHPA